MPHLIVDKLPERHYTVFRLNRPDRLNAFSRDMLRQLTTAVDDLAADPNMLVGIVTGAGRAFCSGADLKDMADRNANTEAASGPIEVSDLARQSAVNAVASFPFGKCPKPIIAAINGPAVGGGMEMTIDCDIRIASTEAYFALFEVKRGVIAEVAAQHLPRTMPMGEAMYLMLTAGKMTAERAFQIGFVQEVVPPELLMLRAIEIAEMIGANAPLSVQASKALLQFWRHYAVEELRRMEEYVWKAVLSSEDAKEGPAAFAEKRAPNWTGR